MKKIVFCLLACWTAFQIKAAEDQWMTDLPKAQARAKAEKKLLLMDFTGSDWCPPCMALKKNVLSSPEFEKFAKDNLVLVEVDFPNSKPQTGELKKANQALSDKFKVEGFPTLIVLDSNGKELSRNLGIDGIDKPKGLISKLEKLKNKS
jgi:protein disulfide-isomerase